MGAWAPVLFEKFKGCILQGDAHKARRRKRGCWEKNKRNEAHERGREREKENGVGKWMLQERSARMYVQQCAKEKRTRKDTVCACLLCPIV
jgi:hypothetical protein